MPNHFTLASRLLAALLCLTSLPALAQWYEIEVLIFEAPQGAAGKESWPETVSLPSAANAIDILAPSIVEELPITEAPTSSVDQPPAAAAPIAQEQPYQALPASSLRLTEAKRRLEAAAYRPLVHLAWRQPVAAAAQTMPLKIYGGTSYATPPLPASETPIAPDSQETPAPPGPETGAGTIPTGETPLAESTPPALWELEGLLRLSAEPQIDFEADLVLRKRLPAAEIPVVTEAAAELQPSATGPIPPSYRLYAVKSKKRLKAEETHYLDHPLLGVLVQLRPYETPVPASGGDAPASARNDAGANKPR